MYNIQNCMQKHHENVKVHFSQYENAYFFYINAIIRNIINSEVFFFSNSYNIYNFSSVFVKKKKISKPYTD